MDDSDTASGSEADAGAAPPSVGWASGPLGAVQREQRAVSRHTAREARALAAYAATMPGSLDRPAHLPGAMSAAKRAGRAAVLADVSEWAASEAAIALSVPAVTAEKLLVRALTLVHRLPATLDALEAGLLHTGHLWALIEHVAPIPDDRTRAALERDLLAWVGRRSVTTPAQLNARIHRELLARNLRSVLRELEKALRTRGVYRRSERTPGMGVLEVLLTLPEVDALWDALGRYADLLDDSEWEGAPRTRAQKMADCLLDLVLRPGQSDLPAVRAALTLVAPVATLTGGEGAGQVGGEPVPAAMVHALAQALGLLPDEPSPPDPHAQTQPASGGGGFGFDDEDVDPDKWAAAEEAWWAEVEAQLARGELPGGQDLNPPPEVQQRMWEQTAAELAADPEQARWLRGQPDEDPVPRPVPAAPGAVATRTAPPPRTDPQTDPQADPGGEPSWWAAADAAVDEASAAQRSLDRALARAERAVRMAEGADRADRDAADDSPAARITAAPDTLTALRHATADHRAALADLLQRTAGGGLLDRPRIAVTDALTGALLALTDAPDLRARATAGRGLGPPPDCDSYRPGAALDRFLRARDPRCRQPGCRTRVPRGGELDHNRPYPDGPTSAGNMTGFCDTHHRGKHQAPGWTHHLTPQGTLVVTTPTGLTATTDPPPF